MGIIEIPEILLPAVGVDMQKWAVNACDQFTSDGGYWREVERLTAGSPSAYNLIFPEIYLKDDPEKRIKNINRCMREYLEGGVFREIKGGFILVERTTPSGTRRGIVLSVDLEAYSYKRGEKAAIRSTEATVEERIPPRVEIRRDAPVELPHVMLLYNDPQNTALGLVERGEILYDSDLNMDGGHVKGTYIKNSEEVKNCLLSLKDKSGLLFLVGDGNHSLATAKTCWDNIKITLSEEEKRYHPARFALCEVVNIYDGALKFEPIHRLVKGVDARKFLSGLKTEGKNTAYAVIEGKKEKIPFHGNIPEGIKSLDKYVAEYICAFGGEVDYIHGEKELVNLTKSEGYAGILLPAIPKDNFFGLVSEGGNLPRKTFSMGEGNEKRYYIEAKKIRR